MIPINEMIDHTILRANAVEQDIVKFCKEAIEYKFASVCINPCWVQRAKEELNGTGVKVCVVIGFPLGATYTEVKAFEAKTAVCKGAEEVDMVINIGKLIDGDFDYVKEDIRQVAEAVEGKAILKVIIETCLLNNDEKVKVCQLAVEAGANFVKTSTGCSIGGATIEDIRLMKETVGDKAFVKASTGIKSLEDLIKFKDAGAVRFGTSSGIKILNQL